jgi:hypothetical protein
LDEDQQQHIINGRFNATHIPGATPEERSTAFTRQIQQNPSFMELVQTSVLSRTL